jgi:hypothetical protein
MSAKRWNYKNPKEIRENKVCNGNEERLESTFLLAMAKKRICDLKIVL